MRVIPGIGKCQRQIYNMYIHICIRMFACIYVYAWKKRIAILQLLDVHTGRLKLLQGTQRSCRKCSGHRTSSTLFKVFAGWRETTFWSNFPKTRPILVDPPTIDHSAIMPDDTPGWSRSTLLVAFVQTFFLIQTVLVMPVYTLVE